MRNWVQDLNDALRRGKSSLSLEDAWMQIIEHGKLWIGEKMSGSVVKRDGKALLMHVGGEWDDAEARWMYDGWHDWARERDLPVQWRGRSGWARFLRIRGFL